jgi:hypothetical protein
MAGHMNLYQCVGNDPTTATDPSGVIGIFFDGCHYKATDNSIISVLVYRYLLEETDKDANRSPVYYTVDIGNLNR